MAEQTGAPVNGHARRRSRTRAALIQAAQEILAGGGDTGVSIQAIADRAGVGFGSFSNHFASKEALFDAAFQDAFDRYAAWRDAQLPEGVDPVRRFVMNVRLTGRLSTLQPGLSRILTHRLAESATHSPAAAPGLAHDIAAAVRELRPAPSTPGADPEVTVIAAAGAIAAIRRAMAERDPAEQARMADALAADLLRMFGAGESLIAELV
ncbi:TetR/AcrR family transcriptional regulator [Winogradskya humida]|uniref:TetR family transcriptional regulator n=1 Tax=Winogradskya humida TaxID=113566 RepID=A0ABQ3ZWZ3_9ACTN|nr:TetR/AcrR family transcriptional regulator [Actinoplanes humidus]GIE23132.1 TetR family transcriptional regulator [Actinoplanes humidus]